MYLIGKIIEVYWALLFIYSIVRNNTFIAIDPVHLFNFRKISGPVYAYSILCNY